MIKIVLICGSLEAGKDGVGDYTRRLAAELIRQGHFGSAIALYDQHVNGLVEEIQYSDNTTVNTFRFAKGMDDKERFQKLKVLVNTLSPHNISLQYVPYSFHTKGTPLKLGKELRNLGAGLKWHVMVHEPYMGKKQKSLKTKLVKLLQITSLKRIKSQLNPVFDTSIAYYQDLLKAIGIESGILGLFGNIPIKEQAVIAPDKLVGHILTGVFFGAVPPESFYQTFIDSLNQYSKHNDRSLEILLCGRSGEDGKRFAGALNEGTDEKIKIMQRGEMSEAELSRLFLQADFGISRVAPRLLGKSGSAIAMLEHGLPLWVPVQEPNERYTFDFRADRCYSDLTLLLNNITARTTHSRLPDIAQQMLNNLNIQAGSVTEFAS